MHHIKVCICPTYYRIIFMKDAAVNINSCVYIYALGEYNNGKNNLHYYSNFRITVYLNHSTQSMC